MIDATTSKHGRELRLRIEDARAGRCGPEGGNWIVTLDGAELSRFDYIDGLWFYPDGTHTVVRGCLGGSWNDDGEFSGDDWRLSLDGVSSESFSHASQPDFSPNGKYAVAEMKRGRRSFVWHDGRTLSEFDESSEPHPFDDGSLMYIGSRAGRSRIAHAGWLGKIYDEIDALAVSDRGDRFCYRVRDGASRFIVQNEEEGPPFHWLGQPLVSRNGRHVAYPASPRTGVWTIILNGSSQGEIDSIEWMRFSADSTALIARIRSSEGQKDLEIQLAP